MKLKNGYVVNKIADEGIIVPIGVQANLNTSYALNSVGLFIIEIIQNGCTRNELLHSLLENYEVTIEEANIEINTFVEQLKEWDLIDELD